MHMSESLISYALLTVWHRLRLSSLVMIVVQFLKVFAELDSIFHYIFQTFSFSLSHICVLETLTRFELC